MADDVKTCQGCGASIYKEHLDRGMAGFVAGKLLCSVCRNQSVGGGAPAPNPVGAVAQTAAVDPSEETIRLIDETEMTTSLSPGGSMMGDTRVPIGRVSGDLTLTRALVKGGNATRCRTFHAKLSEGALMYLDGIFEGKHSTEQHLILTVFY